MDDHGQGEVVHSVFTETTIYVTETGEKWPYVHVIATLEDGRQANLLFNSQLTVMLLDTVTRFMGTVFGVEEVGRSIQQAMDEPIDWDHMPEPPPDVVDFGDDEPPYDPDFREDK
jgi:hypothetical protein